MARSPECLSDFQFAQGLTVPRCILSFKINNSLPTWDSLLFKLRLINALSLNCILLFLDR